MKYPIAYIIYNRADITKISFNKIEEYKPEKLYIIADGPKLNDKVDVNKCKKTRMVVEKINWPCDVTRLYSDSNLGLKNNISNGLNYIFSREDAVIVLEDDCLASMDFFFFCEKMLELYKDEDKVSVVTGNNFQDGIKRGSSSYYFSKYNHCWGWATWKRAWKFFDIELSFWPIWKESLEWKARFPIRKERLYWESIFDKAYLGKVNSWAYPWVACIWRFGGLTATPNINLVSNIGFSADATHTNLSTSFLSNLPTSKFSNFTHPEEIIEDLKADEYVFKNIFLRRDPLLKRMHNKIKLYLGF